MQAPTKYELVINPWTVRKTLEVDGYLWGFLAGARGPIPAYPRHVRKRQTAAYRRPPAVLGPAAAGKHRWRARHGLSPPPDGVGYCLNGARNSCGFAGLLAFGPH